MNKKIALVPLRGGSKSIPKKNIKDLLGKPLCAWVIEAAVNCKFIDEVYVSTDSREIKDTVLGLGLGVKVIDRPESIATDEATTEAVMLHFMESVQFDTLVTIQATSPMLKSRQLDEAIGEFEEKFYDSMLAAVRTKRFFWDDDARPVNYDPLNRPRRQDFDGLLMENGAFYITKKSILDDTKCRLGGKIGIYEMPEETVIEIDEPRDWEYVAQLMKTYE